VKYKDNHLKTVKEYFANAVNTNEGTMGQKLRNIETDFNVGFEKLQGGAGWEGTPVLS